MNLGLFIKFVAAFLVTFVKSEEPWVFLVMTDLHAAEFYSHSPVFGEPGDGDTLYASQRLCLQDIHNQYGGELIIIPGDLNGGKWSRQKWIDKFSPNTSPQEAVFKAGTNCYKTVKNLFSQSGYDKILVGIGDRKYIMHLHVSFYDEILDIFILNTGQRLLILLHNVKMNLVITIGVQKYGIQKLNAFVTTALRLLNHFTWKMVLKIILSLCDINTRMTKLAPLTSPHMAPTKNIPPLLISTRMFYL